MISTHIMCHRDIDVGLLRRHTCHHKIDGQAYMITRWRVALFYFFRLILVNYYNANVHIFKPLLDALKWNCRRNSCRNDSRPCSFSIQLASQSVSAISVDPSARGRQLRQRADNSVMLLARRSDNLTGDEVGERGSRSAGQDVAAKICLSSNIELLIRWRSTLILLSASPSSRPSWYWHRYLPDYYYSTVRCRYRHLPLRRDTNITTTEPWITVPWHWCTKRLQANPRGDWNLIKMFNKRELKSISYLNEHVLYIFSNIWAKFEEHSKLGK